MADHLITMCDLSSRFHEGMAALASSFGVLEVEQVIVHIVPRAARGDADAKPIQLSDVPCQLSPDAKTQLELRLRTMLKDAGRQVVEDETVESELPSIVRDYLARPGSKFIPASHEMARILRNTQSGTNSDGVLLVASGTLDGVRCILLVKIEQEGGMRAELSDAPGGRTFNMKYLTDLFFTSRSRVYKVGLFAADDLRDDEPLYGWAADKQMAGRDVAVFFLRKYLGCRHREEPEELTKRFYEQGQQWVNKTVTDPKTKARYIMAIAAELQSQRGTLSVGDFARNNLDVNDRDPFADNMKHHGVPSATFDKSTDLVRSQLERVQVAFVSGVTITAPQSAIEDETVQIDSLGGKQSRVTIIDEIKEMKGRGAPGRSRKENGGD